MESRDIVVLSAIRTAIGKFGGALKDVPPTELAGKVVCQSIQRSGLSSSDIGHVVFGNVIHTEAKDMYLSRVAALRGGLPVETPALTVNRLCGSGLQAILTAAEAIKHGDADAAIGGGAESMSRAPYWLPAMRWGARLQDASAVDVLVAALTDPFDEVHMGVTAENVAKRWESPGKIRTRWQRRVIVERSLQFRKAGSRARLSPSNSRLRRRPFSSRRMSRQGPTQASRPWPN